MLVDELGISFKVDKTSTIFDIIKSLACRLEFLKSKSVLATCVDDPDCVLVQLMIHASRIFRAKISNATAMILKLVYDDTRFTEEDADCVNNLFNFVLAVLYKNEDSYDNIGHASSVAQQIEIL